MCEGVLKWFVRRCLVCVGGGGGRGCDRGGVTSVVWVLLLLLVLLALVLVSPCEHRCRALALSLILNPTLALSRRPLLGTAHYEG